MKIKKIIALLLCGVCVLSLCSCKAEDKGYTGTDYCLNTIITITAYGEQKKSAVDAAIEEIKRIEALVSPYVSSSEIAAVNANAAKTPVKVSDEVASILGRCMEISEKTGGAFDITVKPLTDLWNIMSENPKVPADDDIKQKLELVNYKYITLQDGYVSFAKEGVQLDLGAAAKGYCADRAVKILRNHGIKNAMLDLGGNVYAMGEKPNGGKWRVGLQDPGKNRGEYFRVEELSNQTAVTSGSYERYFEQDGKIYHHILDPKTGYCADHGLISVTVIGSDSFLSDMLSTAFFVMGESEFSGIIKQFGNIRVIAVDKQGNAKVFE